jgi:hypothetical protein
MNVKNGPGPDYISTKQLPKVEVPQSTLDAILTEVRQSRTDNADKFVEVSTRLDQMNSRIGELEQRPIVVSGSLRAKVDNESQTNMVQDAAIATLVTDVASLKETQQTQLTILTRLDAVAANPMVRKVAYAIGGAILAWLAGTGRLSR